MRRTPLRAHAGVIFAILRGPTPTCTGRASSRPPHGAPPQGSPVWFALGREESSMRSQHRNQHRNQHWNQRSPRGNRAERERTRRTSEHPPGRRGRPADAAHPRARSQRGTRVRWPRTFVLASLGAAMLLALTACGDPGISREDADMLREQIRAVNERLDRVEENVEALADAAMSELEVLDDSSAIEELLADARTEVRNAKSELSDLETQLAPPEPDVSLDGSLDTTPGDVNSRDLPGEMPGVAPTDVPPLGQ